MAEPPDAGQIQGYSEWERLVPGTITRDPLWRMQVYRLALFASDQGWHDVSALVRDSRTFPVAGQLNRALGSIGANIAEGYSRGSGRDRARFYEYALGSARESRDWYYKGRHILGQDCTLVRLDLMSQIIRLLLVIVAKQDGRTLREGSGRYVVDSLDSEIDA